ncbi:hypothetical protein [Phenylobacterium sp.]|uniref:tetratricopeptide repeat protein n=1 Tax=Phenylobacterium sp. TaxID=1871053 RepID=UPI002734A391|nr:hypothetical protein [Phenylobacterium sp.]MDP3658604.1 hypothetical protein [Phenylobacterium sp.]
MRKALAACVGGLALCGAGSATAAIMVLGGGLAEACAQAAIQGESDLRYEQMCTASMDDEALSGRDMAGTLVNRGVMRLRRANWDSAKRDFDKASRIQPDLGEAYVNRGAAFLGMRRYPESLVEINRGLELGVEEPAKAYYNRALAHEGLEDAKSAYLDYQKALEFNPLWELPKEQLLRFKVQRRMVPAPLS